MRKTHFISIIFLLTFILSLITTPAFADSSKSSEFEDFEEANCGSCLLVDMDTNTVLYGQDNDKKIYPASVTKVLTALVVLQHIEAGDLTLKQTITASSTFQQGLTSQSAKGNIQTGEQLSVKSLLAMLLITSHCDAANVLAEAVSGSVDSFAEEMNRVAEELGCTGSHFTNPSGLHNKNHYTTCDDLYLIGKAAYEYKTYRDIIGKKTYTVPATNLSSQRTLKNTNALITNHAYTGYLYEYCTGGKTGSTYPAGYCLLSYAEKDGQRLCNIMMGCNWLINLDGSRRRLQFTESIRLYEWGFASFETQTVVEKDSVQGEITVKHSRNGDTVELLASGDISALLPKGVSSEDLTFETDLPSSIDAPVSIGDTVGTLTVSYNDETLGTVDLLAADTRDEIPRILTLERLTSPSPLPILAGVGGATVVVVIILFHFRQRRS
jgi:D-alanyl-D-alanine carboxypeptidase (penicillin-binding protein 5/6)